MKWVNEFIESSNKKSYVHLFLVNPDSRELLKQLCRQRKILEEHSIKLEDIYQKLNLIVAAINSNKDLNISNENTIDLTKNFPIKTSEELLEVEGELKSSSSVYQKLASTYNL